MDDEKTGNGWHKRKGPLADIVRSNHFDIFGTQEGVDTQLTDLKKLLQILTV